VLAAIPAAALAADLVGIVTANGKPLADAKVSLSDGSSATGDKVGRFLIRNIRPGIYDLQCGNKAPVRIRINEGMNQINCEG
jgi:hypothetical protein